MSKQDEANLLRWLDGDPMTISQDELVATVRRIIAERDELAATVAKLPKYKNTKRAFVPEVDDVWVWDDGEPMETDIWYEQNRWTALLTDRFYSTAAACEEAEGKAARETEGSE